MQVRSPRRILFIFFGIALALMAVITLRPALVSAEPSDLVFTKSIVVETANGLVDVTEAEVLAGARARIHLAVTNTGAERINLLVADALAPSPAMTAECGPALDGLRAQFSGAPTLRVDPALLGLDPAAYFAAMALELDPGATWEAQITVPLRSASIECLLHGYGTVWGATAVPIEGSCSAGASPQCRYAGWTPREADVVQLQEALVPLESNDVEVAVVTPDLGDAPDSTNHFGVAMSAYPAVQANYPTVFDPATGLPEGPKHRHARPLRLGQMASRERDADLNPNRNLNPPADQNNLDTFDDGLNPALLSFNDCQVSTFPLRLTAQQTAVDYFTDKAGTAYLNVWLDVNRDGDWADNFDCGNTPAPEHILINAPVDIAALGVGTHMLTVATELVRWPANLAQNPAWLRVSLSDSPAPTPLTAGTIGYGDGRGPNPPYVLGETEDYLWTPGGGGGVGGPDVAVRLNGRLQVEDVPRAGMVQIAATQMLTHPFTSMQLKVEFGNLGGQTASGVRLVVMPDPALRDKEFTVDVAGDPPLPADSIEQRCGPATPDCRIIVDLGDLPPQRFGTLLVSARARCQQFSDDLCSATALEARAFVESENDVNPANDEATKTWEFDQPLGKVVPPAIIGAQTLIPMPEKAQQSMRPEIVAGGCLTCVDVVGVGVPFEVANVFFDGRFVDAPQADGSGQFMSWADGFAPGLYEITAAYPAPPQALDKSSPYLFFHAPNLPWDPASWTLSVSQFGVEGGAITFPPLNADGIANAERWQIPIWPGAEIEMELRSRCAGAAQIGFLIGGMPVAQLTDPDQDGVYAGRFTAEGPMANRQAGLRVRCEGADQTFRGRTVAAPALPKIVDAQTGASIAGAKVILWENYTATDDLWKWRQWPGGFTGHPNPQMSDADGEFIFVVPGGAYRLDVMAPGYQPFSSGLFKLQGIFPGRTLALQPVSGESADHTVAMTGEGFNPPVLEVLVGDQVVWENADIEGHSAVSGGGGFQMAAAAATTWDSGVINPGERFVLRLDQPGVYTVVDETNPLNQATIIVTAAEGYTIYLPVIIR